MKIGVLYDQSLPYAGKRPDGAYLEQLLQYADLIDCSSYEAKFTGKYECLVNLHGAFFIKPAWKHIKEHVMEGRGLVNLGPGIPFSVPVSLKEGKWTAERQQTAYHEELNIRHGMEVKKDRFEKLEINHELPLLEGFESCFSLQDTLGLIVQFTGYKDVPQDQGSSGPMDAVMHALLTGSMTNGRKTAAPVVMIENTKGIYEGGRWIFINQAADETFWQNGGSLLLQRLAGYAANKAYVILLRPNYAAYYPGEQPTLLYQGQNFASGSRKAVLDISISFGKEAVYRQTLDLCLTGEILYRSIPLDFQVQKGTYQLTAEVKVQGEPVRVLHSGFWGYDRELMESGEELTCGRDYFYKGGKPLPIVGMTYMQSDVHRKYIYLPNVYRWDADFAEMKRAGINMVRTGVWTAHRTVMFNDGIASEEILRAIDAMFLTAKKYDIHIVFNFFAFAPEMWEGINPYLDPRSIKAQKRFISSIVSRHAKNKGVSWDLINEPSVCNPRRLWRPAPNRDMYELAEWRKWLKEKHGHIEVLQERWNCTPAQLPSFERALLPADEDLQASPTQTEAIKGLKAHDYILFTQHVLNRWAAEMITTIRTLDPRQPVTVGQDEGLNAKRPSPFFYQEVVDYTTNHSWWQMDDLYWDGIFSKSPDKPNLIQETGIMYVQNADSKARRTEAELRNILERKYALAFAANNAGAIHWIWNINVYMDILNEVHIGAVRADGTQKLEADVSFDFGDFIKVTAPFFEGRQEEEVAVIYPYANDFSVRDYANTSTKRLSRILGYQLHIPFKAYGEYHLEKLGNDRLIILPSPRTLTQAAWETVMEKVAGGSTLLISGPFSSDEYWNRIDARSAQLGLSTRIENISREETLYIDGTPLRAAFGREKIAWIDKEVESGDGRACVSMITYGKGKVVWSPIPVEMNEEDSVVREVYRYALKAAGVQSPLEWVDGEYQGILIKKLEFARANIYVFVSENGQNADIAVKDRAVGKTYRFRLPAGRVMLFAAEKNGRVLKSYRNAEIQVQ